MQKGDKVTYVPIKGAPVEKGIVKSMRDPENAFVVYHCNDEWHNYEDYIGNLTEVKQLKLGWPEDSI